MERILIIINKSWEAHAALSAITNADLLTDFPDYTKLYTGITLAHLDFPNRYEQGEPKPMAIYRTANLSIEIWCIQNIMSKKADQTDSYYFSRSFYKAKDFHKILDYSEDKVKLIVAYGTAGIPTEVTKNGGLVIGSGAFVYDAWEKADLPHNDIRYVNGDFGQLLHSQVPQDFFDKLNVGVSSVAMKVYFETAMLTPPLNPSNAFQLIADKNIVAVSDVNIPGYSYYDADDPKALASLNALIKKDYSNVTPKPFGYSIETTHGLIRLEGHCENFMFISAATDRDKYFDEENTPKAHAQNFAASYNGGVFMIWFIGFLNTYYTK